jgi:glycosyltransferase involved in cell wall biosynthesis
MASMFGELVHLAPLHNEPAPPSALAYTWPAVHFVPVRPAGGERLQEKIAIGKVIPQYLRAILTELRYADAVQVRCSANISLIALLILIAKNQPCYRWFKYAGNWKPQPGEDHIPYRLQRWLLQNNLANGPVTINGHWPNQPSHIFSFLNPCLTREEVQRARRLSLAKKLTEPIRLLFVGRMVAGKGVNQVLRVAAKLKEQGIPISVDLVGDGPDRPEYELLTTELGINGQVHFQGWISRTDLNPYYAAAHFLLLPSQTEGWPKVASEAMAYGAVPIVSHVSSIPQILAEIGCGVAVPTLLEQDFATAIRAYLIDPQRWKDESMRGQNAADRFTYEQYIDALGQMFEQTWDRSIAFKINDGKSDQPSQDLF